MLNLLPTTLVLLLNFINWLTCQTPVQSPSFSFRLGVDFGFPLSQEQQQEQQEQPSPKMYLKEMLQEAEICYAALL